MGCGNGCQRWHQNVIVHLLGMRLAKNGDGDSVTLDGQAGGNFSVVLSQIARSQSVADLRRLRWLPSLFSNFSWKVFACQFSLNEGSSLRLNRFSLLVEAPPSSQAPRLTPSRHLNQLHREASKQQQQEKTPSKLNAAEWGVPCGSETARVIKKAQHYGSRRC